MNFEEGEANSGMKQTHRSLYFCAAWRFPGDLSVGSSCDYTHEKRQRDCPAA
ncbi:hypothetical protein WMY93_011495 [Mugilogobius chulae]|uniref:C3H1-type domain-containing protein n=1 Tax=Mugilogobius chulae TaxID=88201 RepID=A0AAW0PCT0_9GOBI